MFLHELTEEKYKNIKEPLFFYYNQMSSQYYLYYALNYFESTVFLVIVDSSLESTIGTIFEVNLRTNYQEWIKTTELVEFIETKKEFKIKERNCLIEKFL